MERETHTRNGRFAPNVFLESTDRGLMEDSGPGWSRLGLRRPLPGGWDAPEEGGMAEGPRQWSSFRDETVCCCCCTERQEAAFSSSELLEAPPRSPEAPPRSMEAPPRSPEQESGASHDDGPGGFASCSLLFLYFIL
ncbi:hypothetical protein NHX12_020614 [Muraenolepis orangiensis]|uniref:Uncharacterized protein n=1 Tax=Muraenolepis orangiensis TaxID=630683 RepID=A0A9Q0ETS6_9TELE|nr:hypothetical protein NHX12_020614 [Muraenolepis orangiensis]